MTQQVNPPFFLRKLVPQAEFTKKENILWDQLLRILEQLYERSGGDDSAALEDEVIPPSSFSHQSQINQVAQRVDNLESDVSPVITKKEEEIDDNLINQALARVSKIERKLLELEASGIPVNLGKIQQRLSDIEAQL